MINRQPSSSTQLLHRVPTDQLHDVAAYLDLNELERLAASSSKLRQRLLESPKVMLERRCRDMTDSGRRCAHVYNQERKLDGLYDAEGAFLKFLPGCLSYCHQRCAAWVGSLVRELARPKRIVVLSDATGTRTVRLSLRTSRAQTQGVPVDTYTHVAYGMQYRPARPRPLWRLVEIQSEQQRDWVYPERHERLLATLPDESSAEARLCDVLQREFRWRATNTWRSAHSGNYKVGAPEFSVGLYWRGTVRETSAVAPWPEPPKFSTNRVRDDEDPSSFLGMWRAVEEKKGVVAAAAASQTLQPGDTLELFGHLKL